MRVKEVLKEKGLTQPELAEKLGVSVSAVKQMVFNIYHEHYSAYLPLNK